MEENSCSKDVGTVGTRQGNANGSLQSEGRVATGRELSMEWAESVEDRPMACAQIWTIWESCYSTTSRWVAKIGWQKEGRGGSEAEGDMDKNMGDWSFLRMSLDFSS